VSQDRSLLNFGPDLLLLLGGQYDVRGGDVLLEILGRLGARDGDDVITLGEQPCESELASRAAWIVQHKSASA